MTTMALQIDDFHDTALVEQVMTPAYALIKPQMSHHGAQIGEANVGIRTAPDDSTQKPLMPVHASASRRRRPTSQASHIAETALLEGLRQISFGNVIREGAVPKDDRALVRWREQVMPVGNTHCERVHIVAGDRFV